MRILMFGWEFPPQFSGGLGVATYCLTRALSRAGNHVILALPSKMQVTSPYVTPVFANLGAVFGSTACPASYASPESYASAYGGSLLARVMAFGHEGGTILPKEEFDIIHAHDWLTIPAALAAKRASGRPMVLHIHATEFDRSGGNGANETVYKIERQGMLVADKIIAVSELTKRRIVDHYFIDPRKIEVIHNRIDRDHMEMMSDVSEDKRDVKIDNLLQIKRNGGKFILFAGRITLQKGPDYFVELAERLLCMRSNIYFLMIGTGDMQEQILAKIARAGISDRFFLHGYYTHTELQVLMDLADLYVFPSVSEPFGLVPLEAALRGTPVLLSRQTGVAEVFKNALMVDFWDMEDMLSKTLTLLDHPALANTLRENSKREVSFFDWQQAGTKVSSVYRTLIQCVAANAV